MLLHFARFSLAISIFEQRIRILPVTMMQFIGFQNRPAFLSEKSTRRLIYDEKMQHPCKTRDLVIISYEREEDGETEITMGGVTRAYQQDRSHLLHTTLTVRLSVSINVSGQNFDL